MVKTSQVGNRNLLSTLNLGVRGRSPYIYRVVVTRPHLCKVERFSTCELFTVNCLVTHTKQSFLGVGLQLLATFIGYLVMPGRERFWKKHEQLSKYTCGAHGEILLIGHRRENSLRRPGPVE